MLKGDKMNSFKPLFQLSVVVFLLCFFALPALAEKAGDEDVNRPVADISVGANSIGWTPKVQYAALVLTVSCPDGSTFTKTFEPGTMPYFDISDTKGNADAEGVYTYELQVNPGPRKALRQNPETAGITTVKAPGVLTQTGYFRVKGDRFVIPAPPDTGISKPLDEVIYDDLIVDGSLCVGNDCYSGYAFGFDTIVLMENNLRIYFDDTSNTSSFPNNDWRIVVNDTTDGGGAYFAVQDVTGGLMPFTIEAGAKSNSLYVDDDGQVGIGTSGPVFELHIKEGDTPSIRLHQDTSYGWSEQIWDVGGNETSFFIRDGTHAARLPFRIEPEAPSSSLCIKSDGKIGFGTWSPAQPMELETTGIDATFYLDRTSGATAQISAKSDKTMFGSRTNHKMNITVNNDPKLTIDTAGYIGIGDTTPSYPIEVATANGAYLNTGGNWVNPSSRALKENIHALSLGEAVETLKKLAPVKFNYKIDKTEGYVGFIAEDVPELVAVKDRKGMVTMDVVAVLTKVLQEQQKSLEKQEKTIEELKAQIARMQTK